MGEVYSCLFDFHRSPLFFKQWNIDFTVTQMQQDNNNFNIIYCSTAPDNINDCLSNGRLDSSKVTVIGTVPLSLKYVNDVISVRADATLNLGQTIEPLKAVFITNTSGFVLGYSINTQAYEITNTLTIEKDTILWSIVDGK